MYESYFCFSEFPFENNLDYRFLFISDDHKEVLAALSYFIKTKKGFAIVCGDVGTGKTMLINSFIETLPEYVRPIIVANPYVSSLDLLGYIAKTLNIEVEEKDGILELTDVVKVILKKAKSLNKQFVLIIDEAHLLSDQALEEIRLLSNIETKDQKLLQILLVGQYELSYKLDRPEMRHLRQRLNINRFLSPMTSLETKQYVDHRLKQVGSSFSTIFEDNCDQAIYKMTGGVPRNINQLCDNALLICMSEMRQKVDRKILRKAQEALLTDRLFTPKFAKRTSARRHKLPGILVWIAGCATFLALGIVLSQTIFSGKMGQQLSREASLLTDGIPDPKVASAVPSGSVKNKIPVAPSQGALSKVVSPEAEISPNSAITPALPQTVSPETPGPANLTPSSKQEPRKSASVDPKFLASAGEGSVGAVPGKAASPGVPGLPGQPPNVAEPVGLPAQVKKSNASSGDTLKSTSRPREAKRGETLPIIASKGYRGSEAVILDNPEIKDRDLIHPGQAVSLPWINPNGQIMQHGQIMQLQDNLFYAYYGRYDSGDAIKKVTLLMEQKGVKYKTIADDGGGGISSHRVLLGGYETLADLQKALGLLK